MRKYRYSSGGNNYWSNNAICPYFVRAGSKSVVCERMDEGEIAQTLTSEEEKEQHLINYCSKHECYKDCKLCKLNDKFFEGREEKIK